MSECHPVGIKPPIEAARQRFRGALTNLSSSSHASPVFPRSRVTKDPQRSPCDKSMLHRQSFRQKSRQNLHETSGRFPASPVNLLPRLEATFTTSFPLPALVLRPHLTHKTAPNRNGNWACRNFIITSRSDFLSLDAGRRSGEATRTQTHFHRLEFGR